MTLDKIDELVNFTQEEVLVYDKTYKNVWSAVKKNWTLDLKTKIASCLLYSFSLAHYASVNNFRILSLSTIRFARLHAHINDVNVNISDFNMSKLFPHLHFITLSGTFIYSRN